MLCSLLFQSHHHITCSMLILHQEIPSCHSSVQMAFQLISTKKESEKYMLIYNETQFLMLSWMSLRAVDIARQNELEFLTYRRVSCLGKIKYKYISIFLFKNSKEFHFPNQPSLNPFLTCPTFFYSTLTTHFHSSNIFSHVYVICVEIFSHSLF